VIKHRILVPNDGSQFCRQIYPQIAKFIPPEETELILLRVGHQPEGLVGAPPRPAAISVSVPMYDTSRDAEYAAHPIFASQEYESAEAEIKRSMIEDAHELEDAGYHVKVVVRFGDRGNEIIRYVEHNPVDMIAMTTHWRTGIQKLIFGSVAQQIAGHVNVPIMMIRPEHGNN
jgi:nucleotide-binding universal stress UspA family protein